MSSDQKIIAISVAKRRRPSAAVSIAVVRQRGFGGNEFTVETSLDVPGVRASKSPIPMKYIIEDDNKVHLSADATTDPSAEALTFSTRSELEETARGVPLSRLAAIWNNLPGVQRVSKFENRRKALNRIWRALTDPDQVPTRSLRKSQVGRPKPARKAKGQLILGLLRNPEGATLEELQKASHWQAHSIRGFISGKVRKQLRLNVRSFQREGKRAYAIVADDDQNAAI